MTIKIFPTAGQRLSINNTNAGLVLSSTGDRQQITSLAISNNAAVSAHWVGICNTIVAPVTNVTPIIAVVRNPGTANFFAAFDISFFEGKRTDGFTVVRSLDPVVFQQLGAVLTAAASVVVTFDTRRGVIN